MRYKVNVNLFVVVNKLTLCLNIGSKNKRAISSRPRMHVCSGSILTDLC
jgi:hypothetical protein